MLLVYHAGVSPSNVYIKSEICTVNMLSHLQNFTFNLSERG